MARCGLMPTAVVVELLCLVRMVVGLVHLWSIGYFKKLSSTLGCFGFGRGAWNGALRCLSSLVGRRAGDRLLRRGGDLASCRRRASSSSAFFCDAERAGARSSARRCSSASILRCC